MQVIHHQEINAGKSLTLLARLSLNSSDDLLGSTLDLIRKGGLAPVVRGWRLGLRHATGGGGLSLWLRRPLAGGCGSWCGLEDAGSAGAGCVAGDCHCCCCACVESEAARGVSLAATRLRSGAFYVVGKEIASNKDRFVNT